MDRVRQFLSASEHGDCAVVQSFFDEVEGFDVDSVDEDGNSAMHVAAANGQEQVARLLLVRAAALDRQNAYGWTPLMQAARHGHLNVAALLIQNKANINTRSTYNLSALALAARGGYLQTVRLLVESGVDLNNSGASCEFTPLLAAAQQGHDAVIRVLLDRGSDVNYRSTSTGLTPLMAAALNGHMTSAQILIERGCDPNITNVNEKTALEIAMTQGKREVKGYLERKTTNKPKRVPEEIRPDIIEAVKHGEVLRIQEVLEQDISQRDACSPQDCATPLMFAAMTGRLNIAQLLVEYGCDINKQDRISGWTALMQATYHGKRSVAMYLINMGADVRIQARNGCTAFDMASLIDDVDTELLRVLAAKTMQVSRPEKNKKSYAKHNGSTPGAHSPEHSPEDQPKHGLKAWWSRMSNRFRNLKLGRTFTLSNNRLGPMPAESAKSTQDLTIRSPQSPLVSRLDRTKSNSSATLLNVAPNTALATSYQMMLMETRKTANMYTLDINPLHSALSSETLKPVIPPFLPPPSFDLASADHVRSPLSGRRSAMDSSAMTTTSRSIGRPVKFLQSRSTGNLNSVSNHYHSTKSPSPSSSGGASSITAVHKKNAAVRASATSSVLTTGSDPFPKTCVQMPMVRSPHFTNQHPPSRLFMPRKSATVPSSFRSISNTTSPNSSTSGSSSVTPHRSSLGRSTSSKDSTTSTLTPSPSPTPGKLSEEAIGSRLALTSGSHEDELHGILKKLSLEKYQPIFEEQEVDMEAFLTLSDGDLKELGIGHNDSRRQILTAITELKTGKGQQRQQFHDTMASFQSTLSARGLFESGNKESLVDWSLREVSDTNTGIQSGNTRYS